MTVKETGRPKTRWSTAYAKFDQIYRRPFCDEFPERDNALCILHLVSWGSFTVDGFVGVSKEEVISRHAELDYPDGDAVLAFLAEQKMVVIDGDGVSIHPRFVDAFKASLPRRAARRSAGQSRGGGASGDHP